MKLLSSYGGVNSHVDSTHVWDAEWIFGVFRKACVPNAPRTAGRSLWCQSAWFGVSGVATLVFLLAPVSKFGGIRPKFIPCDESPTHC
jgi:hypothetical protein